MIRIHHHRIPGRTAAWVCAVLLVSAAVPATAVAEAIHLTRTAAIYEGMEVRDALKAECDPQSEVPQRLKAAIEHYGHQVSLQDVLPEVPGGLSISVAITSLYAPGGGGWSWGGYGKLGLKQIMVRTTLYEGKETVGSLTRAGAGKGGALGKLRSTCSILMGEVDQVAEETAAWVDKKIQGIRFQRGGDNRTDRSR